MGRLTSKAQPYCRWCGKPLKKFARTVYVDTRSMPPEQSRSTTEFARYLPMDEPPRTLAECRRLTNGTVLSVSRYHSGTIRSFNEWDGETYEASWDFFCTNTCAAALGRAAVRDRDICGPAYNQAVAAAATKETKE